MSCGVGLLGPPAFPQKAGFEAQTERKVSRWENKLKENTGTQVWEVCVFSPARHAPRKGAGGWESVNLPPRGLGAGLGSSGVPGSSGALAGPNTVSQSVARGPVPVLKLLAPSS